jgi:hypothetical protein
MNIRETITLFSLMIVLASCASDPAQTDPRLVEHFEKIQVLDSSDGSLSCADMQTQISTLESTLKKLDYQDNYWKQKSQSDSQASTLGAMVGSSYAAAGMQMSAQQEQAKVSEIEAVQATYQKRHDYLLQIYLTRKCTPG